jgi:hypothetical protein
VVRTIDRAVGERSEVSSSWRRLMPAYSFVMSGLRRESFERHSAYVVVAFVVGS